MTADGSLPVRIPDLRPVRYLSQLQADATVQNEDMIALAVRIETLLITSTLGRVRPPRVVALALARYLTSFADQLPDTESGSDGARVFSERCASCHRPPGLSGPAVPLAEVGTDPAVGLSSERGTGMYRVPSLHGVSTRGPLLHDGTIASLSDLFDPARLQPSFARALHRPGGVAGHEFGLNEDRAPREALLTYLSTL